MKEKLKKNPTLFFNKQPTVIKEKEKHSLAPNYFGDNTLALFAAFSLDVYRAKDRPALPSGWDAYVDYASEDGGYFGVCYVASSSEYLKRYVIFAHRGTDLSSLFTTVDNFISDIKLACGQVPSHYQDAVGFVKATIELLKQQFKDEDLMVFQTGHSLGAIYADLVSANHLYINSDDSYISNCTFENPGSKPIIEGMISRGELDIGNGFNTFKVFAGINFINSCNEQWDDFYQTRLIDMPADYTYLPLFKIPNLPTTSYLINPYYVVAYTLDQHRMDKIYAYIQSNGRVEAVRCTGGFVQGYCDYLGGAGLSNYWYDYATYIWNNDPSIQSEFEGDFNRYMIDFEIKRGEIWQEASSWLQNQLSQTEFTNIGLTH